MKKIIIVILLLSISLTIMTILKEGIAERQIVDKNFPPYLTEYVKAWGWPFEFIIDNPNTDNINNIGLEDKILFVVLFVDWLVIFILLISLSRIIGIIGKLCRKFKSNKGNPAAKPLRVLAADFYIRLSRSIKKTEK